VHGFDKLSLRSDPNPEPINSEPGAYLHNIPFLGMKVEGPGIKALLMGYETVFPALVGRNASHQSAYPYFSTGK
jgi:hypothetical protein